MKSRHRKHLLFPPTGVMGSAGRSSRVMSYLLTLSPSMLLKFNELSGSIVNYGDDGGAGTVAGCTQNQAGQLGSSEAYLYDGVDDTIVFANASLPSTKALTTQRWCFLIKATSYGEGGYGKLAYWSSAFAVAFTGGNKIFAGVDLNTTDAVAISNIGQVDFINSWALFFVDYDNANALALGKKIRLLRATASSATTLLTLGTDTAGVGTVVTPSADLSIGNSAVLDGTFAGLVDLCFVGAGLWSPAGAPTDLSVPNYIRSLVFGV